MKLFLTVLFLITLYYILAFVIQRWLGNENK